MIDPRAIALPAPRPQKARARIKEIILCAPPHQIVPSAKVASAKINGGRRPMVSDRRENIGWKAVEVKRKEVESQEAELDALKYEVIAG
jgi:hypothetical protein